MMTHSPILGRRALSLLGSLLLLPSCIVDADLGNTETEGASSSSGGATLPPDTTGTTLSDDSTTGGSTPADSGDSTDSTGEPPSFQCPPEPFETQCDVVAQDCPTDFRCVPWSSIEGSSTVCSPTVAKPAARFDACTIDTDTCTDNCAVGDYCALANGTTSGICLGLCDSDGDDATCDAGEMCATCSSCSAGVCFEGCDPLDPSCPSTTSTCTFSYPDTAFTCQPVPEGSGGLGEQCLQALECDPGLMCVDATNVDGCDGLGSCCTELCDLEDGDPGCSNPAHVCITLFFPEPAPAGQEHVGFCALPEADPCATPGNCPPADIDPTVPWCSLTNEAACPEPAFAGFFNGKACEQTCSCTIPCMGPEDCDTPLTGTATGDCVDDPTGPGSPTTCIYSCAAGETCPDGMTCTDQLTGDFMCAWLSPADPAECL